MSERNWEFEKDCSAGQLRLKSEGEDPGQFTGYASVYDNTDLDNEIIAKGAFSKTLAENGNQYKLLDSHNPTRPIGFVRVSEDNKGLHVDEGRINLESTTGQDIYSMLQFGKSHGAKIYDGMSVGFSAPPEGVEINKDGQTVFKSVNLREVSIVAFPANTAASFSSIKSCAQKLDIADNDREFDPASADINVQKYFETHPNAHNQFKVFKSALDVIDGRLHILPRAVYALAYKGFGNDGSNERLVIEELYKRMGRTAPWAPRDLEDIRKHLHDLDNYKENKPAETQDEAVSVVDSWSKPEITLERARHALRVGWEFLGESHEY